MKNFSRLRVKAYIFVLGILTTDGTVIKGNLPSIPVVAKFFNDFIKPMINNHGASYFRANDDNSFIRKIINDKIERLKPYLQDNDIVNEQNTLTLEGEHDTHILEFLPGSKQALRFKNQTEDVEKFKKMQKKIKKALKKEPISEDSKRLITKSVDEMVAHIVSNKCVWSSGKAGLRHGEGSGKPLTYNHMWNNLLNKMQTRYRPIGRSDATKYENNLKHFQQFVSGILKDTQVLSEDYRVVCSVVNINNLNVTGIRTLRNNEMAAKTKQHKNPAGLQASEISLDKKDIDDNETCPYFKVCSEELHDFMTDFFINLKDTAVSTITNYAAMFVRDVKEDYNNEKQAVIKLINETSLEINKKISVIFKKQTEKLSFNKSKDKDTNVHALRRYIKKTVNHVKRQIMNDVTLKLKELRPKLRLTIVKDIDVNLDVDLGNLERELSAKICTVFEICNGKHVARRSSDYSRPKIDKNHLFVRIQLTLDDKKRPDRKIALGVGQAMRVTSMSLPNEIYVGATRMDAEIDVSSERTDAAPYTRIDTSTKKIVAPTTRTDAPTTRTAAPTTRTEAPTTRTDAPTTRNDVPTTRTDAPTTRTDAPTTRTDAPTPRTDAPTIRTDAPTTRTDAPITDAHSAFSMISLIPSNVKLTSAELVINYTAKSKNKKHDKNNEVILENKTVRNKTIENKKFKAKSLETYRETRLEPFAKKISTEAKKISTDTEKILTNIAKISRNTGKDSNYKMNIEHTKKKKHRAKKHKHNKLKTTKLWTVESLETYRESRLEINTDKIATTTENNSLNREKISMKTNMTLNLNMTVDEFLKKKKHHVKKYKSTKRHKKYETKSKAGKSKIKSDNEKIYDSQDSKNERTEGENTENMKKTGKVYRHSIKPSYLLGNHSKIDTLNMGELKFKMTLVSFGPGMENHIEKHHTSKKTEHKKDGAENKEENKEIILEKVYLRSNDASNAEIRISNGTQGECKEQRRSSNLNDNIDDIIVNQNYNTILEQTDGNTETVEDEYYYDYENSTEIVDQNGNDEMYKSERGVTNEIEDSNKEKYSDVKVHNVLRRTFVELEDNKT